MYTIQVVRVGLCTFGGNRRLVKIDSSVCDLIINAGCVVCPSSGLDGPGAVAVKGDRIVSVGDRFEGTARQTLDFPNDLLLPGLVDMYAHPAREGSKYGIDPDVHMLPRGTTTVLSHRGMRVLVIGFATVNLSLKRLVHVFVLPSICLNGANPW